MKNASDATGNRIRDLPACSTVPLPTALPRAQQINIPVQKLAASDVKFVIYWVLLACHEVSTGK